MTLSMDKIPLSSRLAQITEYWDPKIVAELNGQHVKLAKVKGEFIWHHHQDEDELFLILKGHLTIHLRDRVVELDEGDCFVIPKGVEHKPEAKYETHILMFEPVGTLNTGNIENERTRSSPKRI